MDGSFFDSPIFAILIITVGVIGGIFVAQVLFGILFRRVTKQIKKDD